MDQISFAFLYSPFFSDSSIFLVRNSSLSAGASFWTSHHLLYVAFNIPKFEYIKNRLLSFFNSETGTHNFQSDKALDSISSGGFFGKGIGEGTLKNRVPEAHTDYIISVISEEFGVVVKRSKLRDFYRRNNIRNRPTYLKYYPHGKLKARYQKNFFKLIYRGFYDYFPNMIHFHFYFVDIGKCLETLEM